MKILVIDGQGGGVGKTLIAALKREMTTQNRIALGSHAQATAAEKTSATLAVSPSLASLAPKVLVVTTSAPAET